MKRSELEKYLGKTVELTIFGETLRGILHKTGEEQFKNNYNLYLPKKYYFVCDEYGIPCGNCIFRCSHVGKLRLIGGDGK